MAHIVTLLFVTFAFAANADAGLSKTNLKRGRTLEELNALIDELQENLRETRSKRESGSGAGGAVYVRWGRTVCPTHSEKIYDGFVAGAEHMDRGSGSTKICLPGDPEFGEVKTGVQQYAMGRIYGTEYELYHHSPFATDNLHNGDAVCAVCLAVSRPSHVMIPAKLTCPTGWTKEYNGYLMTESYSHHRSSYDCVDNAPEFIEKDSPDDNGALWYLTEAVCGSLHCPPYINGAELTCVVCTK